jgi:hypothetical protein
MKLEMVFSLNSFNDKKNEDEVYNIGIGYDNDFRIYNSGLGKYLSVKSCSS